MRVSKWGNSLADRLPAAVVEALSLREGDDIEIAVAAAPRSQAVRNPFAPRHAGPASSTRRISRP